MNFKLYDLLSVLIPGSILLWPILHFLKLPFDKDLVPFYTAVAFVIGYFVNTFSSWLEDFYYWTWGGKPSNKLLDGKGITKVRFYQSDQVKKFLKEDSENNNPTNDELFSIAYRIAKGEKSSLVEDFNASYAFSRVILTLIIILFFVAIYPYYNYFKTYLLLLFGFVAWSRSRQRGYIFAREVLTTYLLVKSRK